MDFAPLTCVSEISIPRGPGLAFLFNADLDPPRYITYRIIFFTLMWLRPRPNQSDVNLNSLAYRPSTALLRASTAPGFNLDADSDPISHFGTDPASENHSDPESATLPLTLCNLD
jgi:hypothetical protein